MAEVKHYRTLVHGLKVVVGDPSDGEVAPQTVDFEGYEEKYQGDPRKVGYLKTDNPVAIEKLDNDVNVEVISADDYKKATDPKTAVKATA